MRLSFALFLGLGLIACAPTETGNPSLTTTDLALSAHSSETSRVAIEPRAGAISIERIWLSVASVDLDGCEGEPRETAIAGPFVENLLARPKPFRELETDLDRFCGMLVGTTPAAQSSEGVPDELVGQAIVIQGQRGDAVRFSISSAHASHLALLVPEGAAIADEPRRFLVAFDLALLFSSLDLASAVVGSDATIRIDGSNNPSLLSAFEAGVDGSVSLHHDLDRDGELDANETHINH